MKLTIEHPIPSLNVHNRELYTGTVIIDNPTISWDSPIDEYVQIMKQALLAIGFGEKTIDRCFYNEVDTLDDN